MEYREFTGKTVEDAVVEAAVQLGTTSDRMEYEILEKGSNRYHFSGACLIIAVA